VAGDARRGQGDTGLLANMSLNTNSRARSCVDFVRGQRDESGRNTKSRIPVSRVGSRETKAMGPAIACPFEISGRGADVCESLIGRVRSFLATSSCLDSVPSEASGMKACHRPQRVEGHSGLHD
jgi:hypothetical protein